MLWLQTLIENFLAFWENLAMQNPGWIVVIALFLPLLESFLPMLPLVVIISFNIGILQYVVGTGSSVFVGILISAIGSFIGAYLVFLIIRSTFGRMLQKRLSQNSKVVATMDWIENRSNVFMILVLANPYTPAAIFNYAMALTRIPLKRYFFITLISRTIVVALLALMGYIFGVQENILAIGWVVLVYVGIYLIYFGITKLISKKKSHSGGTKNE